MKKPRKKEPTTITFAHVLPLEYRNIVIPKDNRGFVSTFDKGFQIFTSVCHDENNVVTCVHPMEEWHFKILTEILFSES